MSNLWINIRFWTWHLHIGPDWPCVRLLHNPVHAETGWPDGRFSVYQFPGFRT